MYQVQKTTPKFQPELGETYYFLGVPSSTHPNLGLLIGSRHFRDNKADAARASIGNVFETFGEAQKVRRALVAAIRDVNAA